MDREALALRNRALAEAFHSKPLKHRLRDALLKAAAALPEIPNILPPRERILLIRPDHLGDVLLTTPAIHALRVHSPTAEIHALVGPWSADVLANNRDIDVALTLPFPGFSRSEKANFAAPYVLAAQSARRLRKIGYSAAVILRPDHWWGALLAQLAGIPRRIGYHLPNVAQFLTESIPFTNAHAVIQNTRLIELLGVPIDPARLSLSFDVPDHDRAWMQGYLAERGIDPDQPVIAIHPGSGAWVKRWTDANWAITADTLAREFDAAVVLTGGDHELGLARAIAARMKTTPYIMAGETDIPALAALFARSLIVLGPDSGPLHLAAALGTPTVALFGPADPDEFGTWGDPEKHIILTSSIACRPCRVLDWGADDPAYHPCVREIPFQHVLEAARRAIKASKEQR